MADGFALSSSSVRLSAGYCFERTADRRGFKLDVIDHLETLTKGVVSLWRTVLAHVAGVEQFCTIAP